MNLIQCILTTTVVLSLAACDSGGSSGSSGSGGIDTASVNTNPVVISRDNGSKIASTGVLTTQSMNSGNDSTDYLDSKTRNKIVNKLLKNTFTKSSLLSSRKTSSTEYECDAGSTKVTVEDNNNNEELDSGDSISIAFNSCTENHDDDTSTMNGVLTVKLNTFSADSENLNATVILDNLEATENGEENSVDGSFVVDLQSDNDEITFSVKGEKLVFVDEEEVGILSNFDMHNSYNEITDAWTQSQNATIASTEIGGRIVITTVTELKGAGDNHPNVGELKFSGANGGFVSMNADTGNLDTVIVTIFDGNTTSSEELNWDDLDS